MIKNIKLMHRRIILFAILTMISIDANAQSIVNDGCADFADL